MYLSKKTTIEAIFAVFPWLMAGVFGLVAWLCTMIYITTSCDMLQRFEAFGVVYVCSGVMK